MNIVGNIKIAVILGLKIN